MNQNPLGMFPALAKALPWRIKSALNPILQGVLKVAGEFNVCCANAASLYGYSLTVFMPENLCTNGHGLQMAACAFR